MGARVVYYDPHGDGPRTGKVARQYTSNHPRTEPRVEVHFDDEQIPHRVDTAQHNIDHVATHWLNRKLSENQDSKGLEILTLNS